MSWARYVCENDFLRLPFYSKVSEDQTLKQRCLHGKKGDVKGTARTFKFQDFILITTIMPPSKFK